MVHENWDRSSKFYGSSETFLFTFRGGDLIESWDATGKNDMF